MKWCKLYQTMTTIINCYLFNILLVKIYSAALNIPYMNITTWEDI